MVGFLEESGCGQRTRIVFTLIFVGSDTVAVTTTGLGCSEVSVEDFMNSTSIVDVVILVVLMN